MTIRDLTEVMLDEVDYDYEVFKDDEAILKTDYYGVFDSEYFDKEFDLLDIYSRSSKIVVSLTFNS